MVQLFTIYIFWVNVCYIMGENKIDFQSKDTFYECMTDKDKNQLVAYNILFSFIWFLTIPIYILIYVLEWRNYYLMKRKDPNWYYFLKNMDYKNRFEHRYGRKIFDYGEERS